MEPAPSKVDWGAEKGLLRPIQLRPHAQVPPQQSRVPLNLPQHTRHQPAIVSPCNEVPGRANTGSRR